ncbi:MAG: hypothetical protein K940chlam2_00680 [Chlamydiae bacterium]|nr:hypothetical protein [Chlamydiota bacterium]
MKTLLFTVPLNPGMLSEYEAFAAEITGPRKKEYSELLKRYGLKTAKVWHQKLADKEYVFILHEAEDDALERLKTWSSSTHPFDLWFDEQLNKCYESAPEPAHLLFGYQ